MKLILPRATPPLNFPPLGSTQVSGGGSGTRGLPRSSICDGYSSLGSFPRLASFLVVVTVFAIGMFGATSARAEVGEALIPLVVRGDESAQRFREALSRIAEAYAEAAGTGETGETGVGVGVRVGRGGRLGAAWTVFGPDGKSVKNAIRRKVINEKGRKRPTEGAPFVTSFTTSSVAQNRLG